MAFLGALTKRIYFYSRYLQIIWEYYFGSSKLSQQNNVVLTLTSYTPRYPWIHLVITGLFNQVVKPDRIVLYISEEQKLDQQTVQKLARLIERGLEVKYVGGNFRSYKKLVYAVSDYPGATFITVDDDVLYPRELIKTLVEGSKRFPNTVIATRATEIQFKEKREFVEYHEWPQAIYNVPGFSVFPTGVGGILYPPNCFDKDLTNFELFWKLAPSADDIWFKAMTLKHGIKSVRVNLDIKKILSIQKSQHVALYKQNVEAGQNMPQLKAVFDYYNIYSKVDYDKK